MALEKEILAKKNKYWELFEKLRNNWKKEKKLTESIDFTGVPVAESLYGHEVRLVLAIRIQQQARGRFADGDWATWRKFDENLADL